VREGSDGRAASHTDQIVERRADGTKACAILTHEFPARYGLGALRLADAMKERASAPVFTAVLCSA
jgi:hypothetical protein